MSNLIKAWRLRNVPGPRMITIQVPVIDTFDGPEKKIEKMKEELDELLDEFCSGPVDTTAALEELHDVIQVMVGYLLAKYNQNFPYEEAVQITSGLFQQASLQHLDKMEHRATERGWMVVT